MGRAEAERPFDTARYYYARVQAAILLQGRSLVMPLGQVFAGDTGRGGQSQGRAPARGDR